MFLKPVIHFTVNSAHTNDRFLHSHCLFLGVCVGNKRHVVKGTIRVKLNHLASCEGSTNPVLVVYLEELFSTVCEE